MYSYLVGYCLILIYLARNMGQTADQIIVLLFPPGILVSSKEDGPPPEISTSYSFDQNTLNGQSTIESRI